MFLKACLPTVLPRELVKLSTWASNTLPTVSIRKFKIDISLP